MPNRLAVSSADFIRNIGYWQGEALRQPVSITHHGRERLVLAAPDQFQVSPDAQSSADLAALRTVCAAVLENMEEGFLRFDAQLRLRSVNAVAEAFLGQARDTLVGRTVLDTLPDPLASVLTDRLQRVLRSRKAEAFECGAFDGRYVSVRVFPLPEGAGALLQNVTEQHTLRRDREEAMALERATRAHGRASMIRLDARGRIENADDTFCAWTGFQPDDLIGHRFADLTAAGARHGVATALEKVLREGKPLHTEVTLLGRRGEELAVELAAAPVLTDFIARGVQALMTQSAARAAAPAQAWG